MTKTSSSKAVSKGPAHDEPAHSELGPSAADRWIHCPGSVLATRGMTTDSTYARQGTAAHTLAEWARREKRSAWDFLGRVIKVRYESDPTKFEEFKVDGEMADAVNAYVEYCEEFGGNLALFEVRVRYTAWVPHGFGTSDDIRLRESDKRIKITDLKYGQGNPVYAKANPQNRLYALGVFHDLGWLYDFTDWTWELGIFQPRLGLIDTETITTAELIEWANTVAAPGAKRALTPGAPFKAGDWCTFCAIKQTCRTRADHYSKPALDMFETLDEKGDAVTTAVVKDMAQMTKEEMFQLHLLDSGIRKLLDDIDAYGYSELANGREFGDRKLVNGRGFYYYVDPARAEKLLINELGDDAWTEPEIKSPAQIRKLLGKHHKIMVEEVARGEGKPTMVGPEDNREPIGQSALAHFEEIE
jgi:hypothetical protein